jgi:hypothetical protein
MKISHVLIDSLTVSPLERPRCGWEDNSERNLKKRHVRVRDGEVPERHGSRKGSEFPDKQKDCSLRRNPHSKIQNFYFTCAFYQIFTAWEKFKLKDADFNF